MKLPRKTKIVTQPEQSVEVKDLTINRIDDFPSQQFVRVIVNELPGEIRLWEGDDYDSSCSWTLKEVEARIEELLSDNDKEKETGQALSPEDPAQARKRESEKAGKREKD